MSARKPDLRFADDANRDIEDLLLDTRRTWGEKQQLMYLGAILRALRRLRNFPGLGHARDELFYGCRSLQVEQHIIYYHQPHPTELVVVRVLHTRQDAEAIVVFPQL